LQGIRDLTGKFSPDDNITWIWVGGHYQLRVFQIKSLKMRKNYTSEDTLLFT